MTEVGGITWTIPEPTMDGFRVMVKDILGQSLKAHRDRDESTELDRLQYFEGKVDAFEFVLSRLSAGE